MLFLLGAGLATGVVPGRPGLALTALPAVIAAGAIAATLTLRRFTRRAEAQIRRQGEGSRWARLVPALTATSDGIEEALHQIRQADPLLVIGLVGFLVFDQLAFWASFRAVGAAPNLAVIWMAYLIGQLGNWLPVPGGIGGTELGLVGALVLYGIPVLTATTAVLLYRVVELWIPAVLGIIAFVQLRLLLRRETEAINLPAGRHHRDHRPRPRDRRSVRWEIESDCHARTRGLGQLAEWTQTSGSKLTSTSIPTYVLLTGQTPPSGTSAPTRRTRGVVRCTRSRTGRTAERRVLGVARPRVRRVSGSTPRRALRTLGQPRCG